MKKFISCALLIACALSAVACGAAYGPSGVTSEIPTVTSDVPAETGLADNLPGVDLNGAKFRIMGVGEEQIKSIYAEEETGSPISDAVYRKIRSTEERFNCDIVLSEAYTPESGGDYDKISQSILAQDDVYDICTGHDITMANLSLNSFFVNLYDVRYLDFDMPWWSDNTIDSLTLHGKMFLFSNHISYHSLSQTFAVFFNKRLLDDNKIEYPYDLVKDGIWTLDRLNSITRSGYRDLNGNGERDIEDQFGISNKHYYGFLEPYKREPYQKGSDGNLKYVFDLEVYQTLTERFYSLLKGEGGYAIGAEQNDETYIFGNGRSMFNVFSLGTAVEKLSFTDVIYGVVPMPKLDEGQDEYYSGCYDRPCAIPVTASNRLEEIGLLVEALSAEGYREVFPVYFEQALKVRYSDSNEDSQMIDIINDNSILAFSYLYGGYDSIYLKMLPELLGENSTDVSSYAAGIKSAQEAKAESINHAFTE